MHYYSHKGEIYTFSKETVITTIDIYRKVCIQVENVIVDLRKLLSLVDFIFLHLLSHQIGQFHMRVGNQVNLFVFFTN